ncbi:hypothetical protein B0H14DRAFT_3456437 [Mycena olivaceomarginata]|nr:hypothetical protein B0H14DRAFT_3456437 [Mycena olivaceomarginata]
MASQHAGYEQLVHEISSLFSGRAPSFLYVTDAVSPRTAALVVNSVLSSIARSSDASSRVYHAQVNAVACFNSRLLYDTVLNQLVQWEVKWAKGCTNWNGGDDGQRWNENLDGFCTGKGKQTDDFDFATDAGQIVIVVERPERLAEQMPDLIVPLTRLAELTQLDLSVIFVSDVPWEDMRPPFGGSPDPYYVDVSPLSKEALLDRLNSAFRALSSQSEHPIEANPYHPNLRSLYAQYLSVLLDSCSVYVQDPNELQYIAAARWPGFVKPILDAHNHPDEDEDVDMDGNDSESALKPPPEDVRMRLIRIFKPSFKAALEALYPRLDHAAHWAASNDPPAQSARKAPEPDAARCRTLAPTWKSRQAHRGLAAHGEVHPRRCLSGLDQPSFLRRPHVWTRAGRERSASDACTSRLKAALRSPPSASSRKNDVDHRLPAPEYTIPGEHTDMEIARVGIYNTIIELSDIGLLHRASAADKLDGPPTFKCGVSYITAKALAQQLEVPMDDLLWDPA